MSIKHHEILRRAADEIRAEGHSGWGNACEGAAEAIEANQAEIERLRTALEPFARAGDIFEVRAGNRPNENDDPVMEWEDHRVGARPLTVGDFRRAREVFSGSKDNG